MIDGDQEGLKLLFLAYIAPQEVSQDGHVIALQVTYFSWLLALTATHDMLCFVL